MKQSINPRFTTLLCFILVLALIRIINVAQPSAVANFTPIGAMGLFAGAYFSQRGKAFFFPLLTLFISDMVINNVIYGGQYGFIYDGWYWVYGIFALVVLLGNVLLKKVSLKNIVVASIAAAVTHWVLSDFTVWLSGGTDIRTQLPLSRDWAGLQQALAQGFPFMRNFLAGTLAYGAIFFGGFELLKVRFPQLSVVK